MKSSPGARKSLLRVTYTTRALNVLVVLNSGVFVSYKDEIYSWAGTTISHSILSYPSETFLLCCNIHTFSPLVNHVLYKLYFFDNVHLLAIWTSYCTICVSPFLQSWLEGIIFLSNFNIYLTFCSRLGEFTVKAWRINVTGQEIQVNVLLHIPTLFNIIQYIYGMITPICNLLFEGKPQIPLLCLILIVASFTPRSRRASLVR